MRLDIEEFTEFFLNDLFLGFFYFWPRIFVIYSLDFCLYRLSFRKHQEKPKIQDFSQKIKSIFYKHFSENMIFLPLPAYEAGEESSRGRKHSLKMTELSISMVIYLLFINNLTTFFFILKCL